jgi:hypothetical protein
MTAPGIELAAGRCVDLAFPREPTVATFYHQFTYAHSHIALGLAFLLSGALITTVAAPACQPAFTKR